MAKAGGGEPSRGGGNPAGASWSPREAALPGLAVCAMVNFRRRAAGTQEGGHPSVLQRAPQNAGERRRW